MPYRQNGRKRNHQIDRLTVLTGLTVVVALSIIARLFQLQVVNHGWYEALAKGQHAVAEKLVPRRGEVFVRDATNPDDLYAVATNRELRQIFAVPSSVKDPEAVALALETALPLEMEKEDLLRRLSKPNDVYEPLLHEASVEVADAIDELRLDGIKTAPETARFYPFGSIFSNLTGFLGYKGDERAGQYGLEEWFNSELSGERGDVKESSGSLSVREARHGDSFLLTIDRTIQHTACEKLEAAVLKHGADGGDIIIVNPKTGAILAMCSVPNFDPNDYRNVKNIQVFTNSAIFDEYEPGSVMKTLTLSSALDKEIITPDATFTDPGTVRYGKRTIRNAEGKSYGTVTMSRVLEESINTGAVHTVQLLGNEIFADYVRAFGFGERTGITLPGESDGDISSLSKSGDIYAATASFGQGITVTPLQLVMAYAAIVNSGTLMKPYIIEETIKPSGYREKAVPQEVRRVISEKAARTMQAMLVNVVRNGHGKRAAVDGYYIGGKTGTAEVPYPDRPGYDPSKHIGTFVGFGPLADPAFVMLVKIDVPRDVQFAESSAAPLFGDLASFLLRYYRIQPDAQNPS